MQITKRVSVTPSKHAMWRCAIALAHIDGHLSNSETDLIHEESTNFDFTDAQRRQLEEDFRNGGDPMEMFLLIDDKLDRAHLLNFARVLFHIDGDFSAVEAHMLTLLHDRHMSTIDLRGAMRSASEAVMAQEKETEVQRLLEKNHETWVMKAFRYLSGIDAEA